MAILPAAGYIAGVSAEEIGLASMLLGGGRIQKGDRIGPTTGIVLQAKIGDRVERGQPLLMIHANDEARLVELEQRLPAAYPWSDQPITPPPLLHQVIG